jgi:hypothetical protein
VYVCIYRARFRAGYAKGAHDPAGYVARHVLIAGSLNFTLFVFGSRGRSDSAGSRNLERRHPRVRCAVAMSVHTHDLHLVLMIFSHAGQASTRRIHPHNSLSEFLGRRYRTHDPRLTLRNRDYEHRRRDRPDRPLQFQLQLQFQFR